MESGRLHSVRWRETGKRQTAGEGMREEEGGVLCHLVHYSLCPSNDQLLSGMQMVIQKWKLGNFR